jgi:3-oxoacyl-[acyl-carrier protein] reductase
MGILDHRVAIVTGSSSGVGRGSALRLAAEGAAVVVCARRLDRLRDLVSEVEAKGGTALAVACDVADDDDIKKVVATTIERFGKVDILANIAQGEMTDPADLLGATPKRALDAFITGPLQSMRFMQECFPYMKACRYGRIINTGSHTALGGFPGYTAYEMAKGALMALTRNASQEWAQYGIVTNTILPVIQSHPEDASPEARAKLDLKLLGHPMGRIGTPYDDAGPVVAFLASEGAGYLNGQVIAIDGGRALIA